MFLDIGAGDGALVLGASLLYAHGNVGGRDYRNEMKRAVGVEIIPGLVDRSKRHAQNLDMILEGMEASSAVNDDSINDLRNH